MAGARHDSVAREEERMRVKLPKKLIVCCDGTWTDSINGWVNGSWGQPGHLQSPSNVTRIARAIRQEDDDHHPQIVYYQAGIGTGIGLYNHLAGGGTGLGLCENVREAYTFLANNYSEHDDLVPNDSIFLLGFSRGAYTARTLGGFICTMGILRKQAMPHFYECFEDWEHAGDKHYPPSFFTNYYKHHEDIPEVEKRRPDESLSRSGDHLDREEYFRQYFKILRDLGLTQKVTINAIGVFDTVGALGIPVNPLLQRVFPFLPSFIRTYRFFDTKLHNSISNAFHALALDEHRFPYSPAVWERQQGCTTHLEQVWFPGTHNNVGGSYADAGIADITLAWMMDRMAGNMLEKREDFRCREWIKFDDEYLDRWCHCQQDYLRKHPEDQHKGWGRGKLYDSCTLPQSLAGERKRAPGRYHATIYETGNTDPNTLLEDTQEQIHSCVRARIDLGGLAVEADETQTFPSGLEIRPLFTAFWRWLTGGKAPTYLPQAKKGPLHGWQLKDNHASHDAPNFDIAMSAGGLEDVHWEYTGAAWVGRTEMPEARLGEYEMKLLGKDEGLAGKLEFSNNGWRWLKRPKKPTRHGRTMPMGS
ncbi:hypothetical protein B0A54_13626 [Friedmanniomyces endolithicus]|uniref:T6SS Phospholipase effector Tle1-like catalytic domain-containing protein n=1 Tax=Friedmanniomyces endolithicus TaxID=329885 RepID=A0A4U0UG50_9PEZI|nr:hypothetical protein LTS09_010440 [Friedmanniomyces endolithicus]TKA34570.1 hypothetical protein B0A54_13626 [Friedmanniomyces endolithicus]